MKIKMAVLAFLFLIGALSAQQAPNINLRDFGFYRVAAVSPVVHIGDPIANAAEHLILAKKAAGEGASVIVFPEESLGGYTAEDQFLNEQFILQQKKSLKWLVEQTKDLDAAIVVGVHFRTFDGRSYNTGVVFSKGKIWGAVPKINLPNYGEFYDRRWTVSGASINEVIDDPILGKIFLGSNQLFRIHELIFGAEICEDVWAGNTPSTELAHAGANLIVNLSASNETAGKATFRKGLIEQTSARLLAAYLYSAAGPTESTKDTVYGGHSMIYENGTRLSEAERFEFEPQITYADIDVQKLNHERARNMTFGETKFDRSKTTIHDLNVKADLFDLRRDYSPYPFVPANSNDLNERSQEIFNIQVTGLVRRAKAAQSKSFVIGVSGGLDSTLALLVAIEAAKKLNWSSHQVIAVTMPGFGTTTNTKNAAKDLSEVLGTTFKSISIVPSVTQHFVDIGHDPKELNFVYENAQARERTQILFDLANKHAGLVVGTGDLSELCVGYCTYNGDHMSGYGVNSGVPKTLIKHLIHWYTETKAAAEAKPVLKFISRNDISPELLPPSAEGKIVQKTEEILGRYDIIDFVIRYYLRDGFSSIKIYYLASKAFQGIYSQAEILKGITSFYDRFPKNQFKRTTAPPGPKVGSISVSPRADLRLPDEAECGWMLKELHAFIADKKL